MGNHNWDCSMLISISCHLLKQLINPNYGCWSCWDATNVNLKEKKNRLSEFKLIKN